MRILFVGAHLDDIEIAAGGTIAKAINGGHEVKTLIMSKSGYTNRDGKVQRADDVAIKEGTNALHTLGVKDIKILDFETKDIPFRSDVVNAIEVCVSDFMPDIIFTHHPFDTHQAHVGVSHATIAAARRKNSIFFYEPIAPSGRSYVSFKPQLVVDITDYIDVKVAALKEHTSEYNKFGGEDWIEGVHARCRFRGYEFGHKYGEAFEILRIEMSYNKNFSL